jgi:hypothetical protein
MYKAELRLGQGKCISHGGSAQIRAAFFWTWFTAALRP